MKKVINDLFNFNITYPAVWQIIENDLPELKNIIHIILKEEF